MVITLESSDPSISLFWAVISTFYNPISGKYSASYPKTTIPVINTNVLVIKSHVFLMAFQSINGCISFNVGLGLGDEKKNIKNIRNANNSSVN